MSPLLIMLLASAGPLLVGFDVLDSGDEDEEGDVVPEPGDEVEIVDVASFIEDARGIVGDEGPINTSRGTDAVEDFVGVEDESNVFDASGNDDSLLGGMLNDTLIGGEDSDVIEGGDGDDALFGGFQRETRPDDQDDDILDGGAGDDTIFMGNGDEATGGTGADVFVTVQDMDQNVTIMDFNPEEDALAIEAAVPSDMSIIQQSVTSDGVTIELNTGATITLLDVLETVNTARIQFVEVDLLTA